MARPGSNRGYYEQGFKGPKRYCAVCGLAFYEQHEMVRQDGVWKCTVGPKCVDEKTDRED